MNLEQNVNEKEQKAADDIEKYGCHILHVKEDAEGPRFSYSIGINETADRPDIIIFGLKKDLAVWVINEYYRRVKEGEVFEPSQFYSGFIESHDITFLEVAKEYYKECLGWGLWYYRGDDFRMMQLVFPSTSGLWPWDDGAPEDFIWLQPLLRTC